MTGGEEKWWSASLPAYLVLYQEWVESCSTLGKSAAAESRVGAGRKKRGIGIMAIGGNHMRGFREGKVKQLA